MAPRKTQKRKVAKKPKHAIEAHAPKSLFRTKKHKVAKKPKHAVDVPAPKLPSRTKTRKVAKKPKHAIETPAPKSLLGLPPELRNRIHRFAVSDDNMITITKSTAFPEPPLLFTCKTIRQEAIGIYYLANDFSLSVVSWDPSVYLFLAQKDKALRDTYNFSLLGRKFQMVETGSASWENLRRWLRLRYDSAETSEMTMISYDTERCIIQGMLDMLVRMKASPWNEVEEVLELLREGLILADNAWALDQ
jgi:hypothetical protein